MDSQGAQAHGQCILVPDHGSRILDYQPRTGGQGTKAVRIPKAVRILMPGFVQ